MVDNLRQALFYLYRYRHFSPSLLQVAGDFMRCREIGELPFDLRFDRLGFRSRIKDYWAAREILVEAEYARPVSLLDGIKAPVVIDGGANIGMFSLYILSRFPAARCLSFEASGDTFKLLQMNRDRNPDLRWEAFHAALWRENGSLRFSNRPASTSSRIDVEQGDETVPAIDLDTVLQQVGSDRVDLFKIDIEGAEEAFLAGKEDLLRRIDRLVVEIHPALCDEQRVVDTLRASFRHLYRLSGRASSKPLLIAIDEELPLETYVSG